MFEVRSEQGTYLTGNPMYEPIRHHTDILMKWLPEKARP